MKIVTIGRGTIGGGLAHLWRAAGHEVDELGRDGGDVSDAHAAWWQRLAHRSRRP